MPDRPTVRHPGPRAAERITAVPCRATPARVTLRAGLPLLDAMAKATSGAPAWFDLSALDTATLAFVRPAPAPDDIHVAWYSATTTLDQARILRAGAHLGQRDGAPFAHVHGTWAESTGAIHAGHLLPEATVLARDTTVPAIVLDGARMDSVEDTETRFRLFRPLRTADIAQPNAVLATVRPHEVIDDAILTLARNAGLGDAVVRGLGSLIGTRFAGGQAITDHATEVLLHDTPLSQIDTGLGAMAVGFAGPHAEGRLSRSENRICVTFELLLVGAALNPGAKS